MAIGVRLGKPPSEVLGWSVQDFDLLMAHFLLEDAAHQRAEASRQAKSRMAQIRR